MKALNQIIFSPDPAISLYLKREDLLHPFISGNKYRKLKYNLTAAAAAHYKTILTFGGAYSNHIAALAYAAKINGYTSVGIIRGDEFKDHVSSNPTLKFAVDCGMKLEFVSRKEYRDKDSDIFLKKLVEKFDRFYLLPEGGTNSLAVKGCSEILIPEDFEFDYICCAAGTGGTAAGILQSMEKHQELLIFPALKGVSFDKVIEDYSAKKNWKQINNYEFGGYGKITPALITFINNFYKSTAIPIDPVYTSKMLFGVMDLIVNGFFPKGSKILAIHTGGLQGVQGMNIVLKKKNLPLIQFYD